MVVVDICGLLSFSHQPALRITKKNGVSSSPNGRFMALDFQHENTLRGHRKKITAAKDAPNCTCPTINKHTIDVQ